MPSKPDDGDAREENAPALPTADSRTERHLLKARKLLREARSRLTARDDDAADSKPDPKLPDDDSE